MDKCKINRIPVNSRTIGGSFMKSCLCESVNYDLNIENKQNRIKLLELFKMYLCMKFISI